MILQGVPREVFFFMHPFSRPIFIQSSSYMTLFKGDGLPFMNLKWKFQLLKPNMTYMLAKNGPKSAIFHQILMKMPFLWPKNETKSPKFAWNTFKGIKTTLKS